VTTLTHRPEPSTALAEDPHPSGLSQGSDELTHLKQEMRALVFPLAQVRSKAAAVEQAATIAPGYIGLAMQWEQARLQDSWPQGYESEADTNARSPLFDDILGSDMVSEDTKEKLCAALESSMAYFNWIRRGYENLAREEAQRVAVDLERVGPAIAGAEAAFLAIGLTLKGTPGSAPAAVPVLAELVDRIWTEVEDVFLSHVQYDEEGETIPLSQVKAELGL